MARVRGIIIEDGKLMLMKRLKKIDGSLFEYYSFPGGMIEEGESIEEALLREIDEELGIKVEALSTLCEIEHKGETEYFIVSKYVEGTFGTGTGPEFTSEEYKDNGKYIPELVNLKDIKDINLLPEKVKEIIMSIL